MALPPDAISLGAQQGPPSDLIELPAEDSRPALLPSHVTMQEQSAVAPARGMAIPGVGTIAHGLLGAPGDIYGELTRAGSAGLNSLLHGTRYQEEKNRIAVNEGLPADPVLRQQALQDPRYQAQNMMALGLGIGTRGLNEIKPPALPLARARVSNPIPEAQRLLKEDVPLTVGQQKGPNTIEGQLEAVTDSNPLGMRAPREAAKEAWQIAQVKKSVHPEDKTPLPGKLSDALKDAYARFDAEYSPLKGEVVEPAKVNDLLSREFTSKTSGIDARTRAQAQAEVQNAFTALPGEGKVTPEPIYNHMGDIIGTTPVPEMTAGNLMKVRSLIRESQRTARSAQDYDKLRILETAEDALTRTLHDTLPEGAAAKLKDIDRRYAIYSTVEGASPGGQIGFTPLQLSKAVERSAGRRLFKHGEAGDLQDSAAAARTVFEDAPKTGFRTAVMSALPYSSKWGAPYMNLRNRTGSAEGPSEHPLLQSFARETSPLNAGGLGLQLSRALAAPTLTQEASMPEAKRKVLFRRALQSLGYEPTYPSIAGE